MIEQLRKDMIKKQESGECEKFCDWEEVLESLTKAEILENKFIMNSDRERDENN